jgi:hypothetical protein
MTVGFSLTSPTSPTISQVPCRFHSVSEGHCLLGVDDSPGVIDLPKHVRGALVADLDVVAIFKPVWDLPPVLAVVDPNLKGAGSGSGDPIDGDGVGIG